MRGPISIAVTGALGLASEAIHAVKHRNDITIDHVEDDDDWMLDDTEEQLEKDENDSIQAEDDVDVDGIVDHFMQLHPVPNYAADQDVASLQLAYPVIIPQRRPHSKSRGFVRAYAPILQERGIDQKMFIDFLKGFDKSIKAQSLFMIANLAVSIGSNVATVMVGHPLAIGIATFAVHTTIEMGRRVYIAKKLNTYLLDINEKVFKPRGLYALVMAYKPTSTKLVEVVDLDTSVAMSAARNGSTGDLMRINSGSTQDESQMPIAAPLVFPGLQSASDQQKKNAFKKASGFFSDYSDRRAQAIFDHQNPDSSLSVAPKTQFASRWSDPNHPVNTGGPLSIITGGKISPDTKKIRKREEENRAAGLPIDQGTGGLMSGMKRKLRENALYLLIVDMPSEEQLREAAALEAQLKEQQKS